MVFLYFLKKCTAAIVAVLLVILCFFCVLPTASRAEFGHGNVPSVLILHSYSSVYPWTKQLHNGILSILDKAQVAYRVEFMDSKYYASQEYFNQLKEIYAYKYHDEEIQGIITTDNNALHFVLNHRNELFAGSKIIACGVNNPASILHDLDGVTIIVEKLGHAETVAAAIDQNPQATQMLVIGDSTTSGQAIIAEARQQLVSFKDFLSIQFLSWEPFASIKEHVKGLEDKGIVYLPLFLQDSTGRNFHYSQAAEELAAISRSPIYVSTEYQLVPGVVGGDIISGTEHGKLAARLMLDFFQGKDVLPVYDKVKGTHQFVFDYNGLKNFNISLDVLPGSSLVLNEPVPYLQQHRDSILSLVGLLVVVLLIFVLILLNQAKKEVIVTKSKALEETEARYHTFFEQSPISLWEQDLSVLKRYLDDLEKKGVKSLRNYFAENPEELHHCLGMITIVEVNRATLELYDFRDRYDLNSLVDIIPPEAMSILADEAISLLKSGSFEGTVLNKTLTGREISVEMRVAVASGFEKTWEKVFVSVFDITEQEALKSEKIAFEKQIQQSQKLEAIGSLAGGIAHDFNNILSPIMGRAELMLVEKANEETLREHCLGILEAAKRARNLVKQILTFSRQVDQVIKPIDIAAEIRDVTQLVVPTLPSTISIKTVIPEKTPAVMADATQIHQVVMNLVTNASHAMDEAGGTLTITLGEKMIGVEDTVKFSLSPGRYLSLSVKDTGQGMSKQVMGQIFNPYFTTKGEGKGSGLGLSVVHGIIRGYGGDVTVTSELGHGSEFTVYLPIVEMTSNIVQTPVVSTEIPRGQGEHILLVDDETSIADVTRNMLEKIGYKVTMRVSSYDALEAFRNLADTIDLVITDLTMPQMTGLQLFREIRSLRADMKFIICTGFSEQLDDSKSQTIGVEGFLNKPVVMADLAQAVRTVLDGGKRY
jgi:signal transduction histidine kinase/CheY-like chemotaxis protein